MYNIRYHIASLVSVFLALALGLVLGGLIVDKTSGPAQTAMVDSLKSEFAQVRTENKQMRDQNKTLTTFGEDMATKSIAGQLNGYSIFVLGNKNSASNEAVKVVEASGAKVISVTVNASKFDIKDTKSASAPLVTAAMATYSLSNPVDALAVGVAAEWSNLTSTERPLTQALISDGVIAVPDADKTFGVVLGVVNTLETKKVVEPMGVALTKAFAAKGYATVGATLSSESDALSVESWNNDLSGMNTLGTPIGSYSLIAILKGAPVGLYGTANSALALYPAMPDVVKFVSGDSATQKKTK